MHKIGALDDFDSSQGTYCMFFRPRIEIRRNLYKLSQSDDKTVEGLDKLLSEISLNDY